MPRSASADAAMRECVLGAAAENSSPARGGRQRRQVVRQFALALAASALAVLSAWAAPSPQVAADGGHAAGTVSRHIDFSGYRWSVKRSDGKPIGPGPNIFSDSVENAWVDGAGRLHLRLTYRDGVWHCAEVVSERSFGYGSYHLTVESDLAELPEQVVLGFFTWSEDPRYHHREMDIEFIRPPAGKTGNAQYTVQPHEEPGQVEYWVWGPGNHPSVHTIHWTADEVRFRSNRGADRLAQWRYTNRQGIPLPGDETPRINLWLLDSLSTVEGQTVEVVISRFEYERGAGQFGGR